ncbi:MAG TPA: Dabb family protein [Candidatus Acidoferrum sp.]|nr:Dabb family protein [Candidatus Acidoferrum sp.]
MVRHIVIWKLNDAAREKGAKAVVEHLQAEFDNVVGKIDGMLMAKVSPNLAEGDYDIMLYSEFTDFEAVKAYQPHPLHQAIKKIVAGYTTDRVAFDAQA